MNNGHIHYAMQQICYVILQKLVIETIASEMTCHYCLIGVIYRS